LRDQAEAFFSELGMSISTAFSVFVRQALRQGKIPFEIISVPDPFYSIENFAVLERSMAQLGAGKTVTKTLDELRAME